jgi:hypothetical protein
MEPVHRAIIALNQHIQQPGLSSSARFCAALRLKIILSNPLFARFQMLGHLPFTKLAFAKATDARGSLPFGRPFRHIFSPPYQQTRIHRASPKIMP